MPKGCRVSSIEGFFLCRRRARILRAVNYAIRVAVKSPRGPPNWKNGKGTTAQNTIDRHTRNAKGTREKHWNLL